MLKPPPSQNEGRKRNARTADLEPINAPSPPTRPSSPFDDHPIDLEMSPSAPIENPSPISPSTHSPPHTVSSSLSTSPEDTLSFDNATVPLNLYDPYDEVYDREEAVEASDPFDLLDQDDIDEVPSTGIDDDADSGHECEHSFEPADDLENDASTVETDSHEARKSRSGKVEVLLRKSSLDEDTKTFFKELLLDYSNCSNECHFSQEANGKIGRLLKRLNDHYSGKKFSEETKGILEILNIWATTSQSSHLLKRVREAGNGRVRPVQLRYKGQDVGYHIPIEQTLKLFLNNSFIVDEIHRESKEKPPRSNSTVFESELDCDDERRREMLGKVRAIISIDDFTIGSATNRPESLCAISVEFANIPVKYRHKQGNIQLLALLRRDKINAAGGFYDCTEFLRNDLKSLIDSGIDAVTSKGETVNLGVALIAACLDNLAGHEVSGFKKNFGKGFICRYCFSKKEDLVTFETDEKNGFTAKPKVFPDVVFDLDPSNPPANFAAMVDGEKKFILEGVPRVRLMNLAVVDRMHDTFEGVAERIILYLIEMEWRRVKELPGHGNFKDEAEKLLARIQDKSLKFYRATPIIKYSATTTFNCRNGINLHFKFSKTSASSKAELLARFLDIFPEIREFHPELTKLVDSLVAFSRIVSSYKFEEADITAVRKFSEDLFTEAIGFVPLPKLHFLTHYWQYMKQFGPLAIFCTLRWERQYQRIKL